MKYVFFINPAAGKGKGPEILVPAIKNYFKDNKNYEIVITSAPGDAKAQAEEIAKRGEELTFFACGGDGTFYEVLNGACKYENVNFGVIPCGSGNDFLKFFGPNEKFLDVAAQIEGKALPMDAIKTDEGYCMNLCNLGMDAVVADNMRYYKHLPFVSGSLAYKLAIVKVFLGKLGQKAKIWVDGKLLGTYDCLFAVCANGPVYGGGYKSAPNASPMDGKLNWLIVEKISKLKILKFIKMYEKGLHENFPFCHLGECETMEIECEKAEPVSFDGEIVHKEKVIYKLARGAVKFVLPRGIFEQFDKKTAVAVEA